MSVAPKKKKSQEAKTTRILFLSQLWQACDTALLSIVFAYLGLFQIGETSQSATLK